LGLLEVEAPEFLDNRHLKVVTLLAVEELNISKQDYGNQWAKLRGFFTKKRLSKKIRKLTL
jgi:hypothetical protein